MKNNFIKSKRPIFIKFSFLFIIGCTLLLNGCKKEEDLSINLIGTWTAIDKDITTDYFTLMLSNKGTFSLRIDYGAQSSYDHKIWVGNYTYSNELMYFWLETVWWEGSEKANTAFKIYSITDTEMITSSFYGGENNFRWVRK